MSEPLKYKLEIEAMNHSLDILRGALRQSENRNLEESVEELATCLEELRSAEEELYEKDQSLATTLEQLRDEHRRYRDLFEFSPDGYLVLDSKGVIQEANLIAAKMLKVRRDRLLGKPIYLFLDRGIHGYLKGQFRSVAELNSPNIHKVQTVIRPRGDAAFHASITLSIIYDARGIQTGVRLLIRDVTETRQKEAELNE